MTAGRIVWTPRPLLAEVTRTSSRSISNVVAIWRVTSSVCAWGRSALVMTGMMVRLASFARVCVERVWA